MRNPALISHLRWRLKRAAYTSRRVVASLALRGVRGTLARIAQEFRPRRPNDPALQLLPLDGRTEGLALPASPAPRVSVVIPAYGELPYTLACLRSIMQHGAEASFEVIVVDDASPDGSAKTLAGIGGLRLFVNPRNLGFVGSCNAGAEAARGEFLLFLNNDTQVTPGWLDALLRCFDQRDDCGIAGSRLVYPDGRLQEAGGLVFGNGTCWNTGRFESRDASAWRYRRQADYVSGASLLIRRDLFQRIGGFDERYAPGYYEDADLAFAVRKFGLRVYYEPASVVIHCEGVSAGTDPERGMKRHQSLNQAKFVDKWTAELATQPAFGTPLQQAIHWRSRGRVLVVDAMTPEPTRDSGSLRLHAILRLLDEQGWSVTFIPDDGRASAGEIAALGELGCETRLDGVPGWLRAHGRELHAAILCRHTVAGQYATLIRRYAPQAKLLFDTVDLHFLRERRAAELGGSATLAHQAANSKRSELALIAQSDVSFVVSPHEKALLADMLPQARVELLSNIHSVYGRRQPWAGREDLMFIGGYGHPPNSDAIRWIAGDILPRLRQAMPAIRVHVFGDLPDTVRRELAMPGLELHGRVADLTPWLDRCLASLAPLRFGAGVKGKINLSMSHGLPVVATAIAVEGMRLDDGANVLVADDAAAIVEAVLRLQRDEPLWRRLSDLGLDNVRRHFSADAAAEVLHRVLD